MDLECQLNIYIYIVVPIINGLGDIKNCCCYRTMMLLEHGMKVVESVFEKMLS